MTSLILYVVVGVVSYSLGLMTRIGYLRVKGYRITVPYIARSSKNFTIAAIALSLLAVLTIWQVQTTASKQEDCNIEFRQALAYNTELNAQDRDAQERMQELQKEDRAAFVELIDTISRTPIGTEDADSFKRDAYINYTKKANKLTLQIQLLASERAQIQESRKPYPEPSCGTNKN